MMGKIGLFVLGATLTMACGDAGGDAGDRTSGKDTPSSESASTATNEPPPACPADVPAATAVASDPNATGLRFVGDDLYYQSGTRLMRVAKGGQPTPVYDAPDLVSAWVDASGILVVASPKPPTAVLRALPPPTAKPPAPGEDKPAALDVTTDWNAAGTRIFAADAERFYLLADTPDGEAIHAVDRASPAVGAAIVEATESVVSHPQLAAGALWFVRDQGRVFRFDLAKADLEPAQEIFGIGGNCSLAIGSTHAFCATGGTLEQRDLSGANPKTVLDLAKSKTRARLGRATAAGDSVIVRADTAATGDASKYVLRSVRATPGGAEERLLGCGREAILDVAVSDTVVAWTERGKGVFVAQR